MPAGPAQAALCGAGTLFLPAALGHCISAGSLGLLVPFCLPCNVVSVPRVAFVSLHPFWSLAGLYWLFGSWPNSSWGLYRNC